MRSIYMTVRFTKRRGLSGYFYQHGSPEAPNKSGITVFLEFIFALPCVSIVRERIMQNIMRVHNERGQEAAQYSKRTKRRENKNTKKTMLLFET